MTNVISVIVSNSGRTNSEANQDRIELAKEIAAAAKALNGQVVALPAGYLMASSEADAKKQATALAAIFDQVGAAVVGGIDAEDRPKSGVSQQLIEKQLLPFYAFGAEHGALQYWERQRSTRADQAEWVPPEANSRSSVVHLAGIDVALFACGEFFNESLRENAAAARPKVKAMILLGHESIGREICRLFPAFARHSRAWVLLADHRSENMTPRTWCFDPLGKSNAPNEVRRVGTRATNVTSVGLWAELCRWTISRVMGPPTSRAKTE